MQVSNAKAIKIKIKDVVKHFIDNNPTFPIIGVEGENVSVGNYLIEKTDEGFCVKQGRNLKHVFNKKSWALAYAVKSFRKSGKPSGLLINRDIMLKRLEEEKDQLELSLENASEHRKPIIEARLDRIYYELDLINVTVKEDIKSAFSS